MTRIQKSWIVPQASTWINRPWQIGVLLMVMMLCMQAPGFAQSTGGDLFVSSSRTNSVKRFDRETGAYVEDFIPSLSGGLVNPQEVIFRPDGHLYVVGFGNTKIKRYDSETGEYQGDFSSNYDLRNPSKMTYYADSLIYVSQWAGTEKVIRFDANTGAFVDEFTAVGVTNGCGHAWDEDGNLYVASWGDDGTDGNVQKFNSDGDFLGIYIPTGSGGLSGPVNVWFRDGDLFVADWSLGAVLRYAGDTGEFKERFVSGMTRVEGFLFDDEGHLYLADWEENQINRYDANGQFIDAFATEGEMMNPNSIAFGPDILSTGIENEVQDDADLVPSFALRQNYPNPFYADTRIKYYVADASHVTIRIYDLQGELVRTLPDGSQVEGERYVDWDGRDDSGATVASGVYFYALTTGEVTKSRSMILLR